jgi:hypothetical protein
VGVLVGVAVEVAVEVGVAVAVAVGVLVGALVRVGGFGVLTAVLVHFFTVTRWPFTIFVFIAQCFAA